MEFDELFIQFYVQRWKCWQEICLDRFLIALCSSLFLSSNHVPMNAILYTTPCHIKSLHPDILKLCTICNKLHRRRIKDIRKPSLSNKCTMQIFSPYFWQIFSHIFDKFRAKTTDILSIIISHIMVYQIFQGIFLFSERYSTSWNEQYGNVPSHRILKELKYIRKVMTVYRL